MVHWGWRVAMVASALPALMMALIWHGMRPAGARELPSVPRPVNDTTSKSGLWTRGFIFLTLSYTLQGYVGYIFVDWFFTYLVDERHFTLLKAGWWSSLPWVLSMASIPLGGLVSDRLAAGPMGKVWGRRVVPMAGMAMSAVLISFGAHAESAEMAAILFSLATAFVLCVEGPFWTAAMQVSGKNSGTAGGIMNLGCNIGGFISPVITPFIAAYKGWENALYIAAVLAGVAALLWLGVKPAEEEIRAEAPVTSTHGAGTDT